METKGKKKLLNMIMVLLILVIAASGVLTVGKIQGWFDPPKETYASAGQTKGIVSIQRSGIGYTLSADAALQSGDTIETKKGAQAELLFGENGSVWMNEKSELTLTACEKEASEAEATGGEVFGDLLQRKESWNLTFAEHQAELSGAVFSVSVQVGSCSLNIYAGDVSVHLADGTQERVEAGETLSVTEGSDGASSYQIQKLQAASLNEFLIQQAKSCDSKDALCFTTGELQQVLDDREAEKQAALEAALHAKKIPAQDAGQESESESEAQEKETAPADEGNGDAASDDANSVEEYVPEASADEGGSGSANTNVCTISIVCDTILDNMDQLDAGKEAYVPANGTILSTSSVEFEDGETVFDVLKRVCDYAGIQLEYSWTPLYNSYYIEGINNLYEFNCGNESGWMYKVNGWFPNYGCSSYTLKDGDNIVWCYTCNGLGADVGGPTY